VGAQHLRVGGHRHGEQAAHGRCWLWVLLRCVPRSLALDRQSYTRSLALSPNSIGTQCCSHFRASCFPLRQTSLAPPRFSPFSLFTYTRAEVRADHVPHTCVSKPSPPKTATTLCGLHFLFTATIGCCTNSRKVEDTTASGEKMRLPPQGARGHKKRTRAPACVSFPASCACVSPRGMGACVRACPHVAACVRADTSCVCPRTHGRHPRMHGPTQGPQLWTPCLRHPQPHPDINPDTPPISELPVSAIHNPLPASCHRWPHLWPHL
jgi:hypothetical protein